MDSTGSEDRRVDERLLFNQQMTALLLGISTQAFSKWGLQPWERRGREALYYWPDVRDELVRRRAPEPPPLYDEEFLDLGQERARLAAAQADKIELELAIKRGEVAYLPHVHDIWARLLTAARSALLALPSATAARVPDHTARAAVAKFVEQRVHEILTELSEGAYLDGASREGSETERSGNAYVS